jgi:hypothetical protein
MPRYAVTMNVIMFVEASDEDGAEMAAEEALGTLDFARDDIDADIDWEVMDVMEDGCEECTRSYGPHYTGRCAH